MAPNLNHQSSIPIYQQIADWMRKKIQSGEWQDDEKLMSETDLAVSLNVSRGTIRKAIETLISEKLLLRIHGKGTFVRNKILLEQKPTWRLAGFSRDLKSRGIPYSTEVLEAEIVFPSELIRDALKLAPDEKIFHLKRLRKIKDQPVLLIENHIVYKVCASIEKIDFSQQQLYVTLEDQFNVQFDWSKRIYKSQQATPEIAKLLKLDPNAALMYIEELYHNKQSLPIEYTRAWFDAQVFQITTIIKREEEKREFANLFQQSYE